MSRKASTAFLSVAATILFSLSAYAYLCRPFNVKNLAEESTLICKVRVISLDRKGFYEDKSFHPPLRTKRILANVRIVSTIKGKAPDTLTIVYPEGTQSVLFTGLSKDEVCIVFLKGGEREYEFADTHNGKMACVPTSVAYQHGGEPGDRLLSELIALCSSGAGETQLAAVEHLGELGDKRASPLLRGLSESGDPALRGVALVAMIQIRDAPNPEALLEYLNQDPASLDYGKSLAKYGTSAYAIANLTGRIMNSLETSVEVDSWYKDMIGSRPSASLAGFDYVAFYERALDSPALKNSPPARCCMASTLRLLADERSIPLVKRLLDDSSADVRYLAVTALTRIFREGPFPAISKFESSEAEYISYWKTKLKSPE